MKNVGDTSEHRPARNTDLYEVFLKKLEESRQVQLRTVLEQTVKSPAKRFYVGRRRAQDVVTHLLGGGNLDGMRPERARMFSEIFTRCKAMMESGRAIPLPDLIDEVLRQPAPEFYLTPGSAAVIIHYIRTEKR